MSSSPSSRRDTAKSPARPRRSRSRANGSEPALQPSHLAAITVVLGALIVILSQLVTAYSLKDDLGEIVATVTLVDKHGYIPIFLAVLAIASLVWTLRTGNRTGALLIVVLGLTIVFVFLIVDLPDVGSKGLFNAPTAGNLNATGKAATGLWLELIGGVILAFSGFALSTLDSSGLKAIWPGAKKTRNGKRPPRAATADDSR